jgi:hypothetical protein
MNYIKHLCKTFCAAGVVVLFCSAAGAQVERPLTRDDRKVLTEQKPPEKSPPADAQPAQKPPLTPAPMVQIDKSIATELLLADGVWGQVRWKKEYGLPYNRSNDGRPVHPYPCQIFRIRSTVAIINKTTVELPRGTAALVGTFIGKDFGTAGTPPEDGDYYVCHFNITDLPRNSEINVQVEIDPDYLPPGYTGFDRSVRLTAPWVGGAEPQPPPDKQRKIVGNTRITLTEKEPRAKLVFEMVYAP